MIWYLALAFTLILTVTPVSANLCTELSPQSPILKKAEANILFGIIQSAKIKSVAPDRFEIRVELVIKNVWRGDVKPKTEIKLMVDEMDASSFYMPIGIPAVFVLFPTKNGFSPAGCRFFDIDYAPYFKTLGSPSTTFRTQFDAIFSNLSDALDVE